MAADAYRGALIKEAIMDFLRAVSGNEAKTVNLGIGSRAAVLNIGSGADLVVYVGHNGLMDFSLDEIFPGSDARRRDAVVLAFYSRDYFSTLLDLCQRLPPSLDDGSHGSGGLHFERRP